MKPDIREWKDIDADWLTAALQADGIDAKVKSFTAKPVGTGQIGDCARFVLDYASAAPDAPKSIVGKFPSSGEQSRATGKMLFNYYREVKFYQLLKENAGISTPHCYFTDMNEETHDFVLMMEDLAPAEQGDQLQGATLDQTKLVISEAAKLHAAYWNDDSLDNQFWIQETSNAPDIIPPELFGQLWHGFIERYGDRVTPQARKIGGALSPNMEAYAEMRAGPRCLIHTDFRPDNMLFSTPAGGKPITVVDWQSFAYGPAASDIGYFIAGALDVETRRSHEKDLLELYASQLAANGAGDYASDMLKQHYVIGAYQHFMTAYFAAMMVTQTERGDNMFFRMLDGAVDLISDHNASDWFV
jgi:hypothetical protein